MTYVTRDGIVEVAWCTVLVAEQELPSLVVDACAVEPLLLTFADSGRHRRLDKDIAGIAVEPVKTSGKGFMHKTEVDAKVCFLCGLPFQVGVTQLYLYKPGGQRSGIDTREIVGGSRVEPLRIGGVRRTIVGLEKRVGREIADGLVADEAIAAAQFQVGDEVYVAEELFVVDPPACCEGGEDTIRIICPKARGTVPADREGSEVTVAETIENLAKL
jgi:hypothetical protein